MSHSLAKYKPTPRPDKDKITLSVPRFICLRAIAYESGKLLHNSQRLAALLKELATIEARETVGIKIKSKSPFCPECGYDQGLSGNSCSCIIQ